MSYTKPEIAVTYFVTDLYGSGCGFASVAGDDSPNLCGNDLVGPGADANCLQ